MATVLQEFVPSTAVGNDAKPSRVVGLDAIRFVCATVVLLGHLNLLPHRLSGQSAHGVTQMAIGIWNTLFNGSAAVIVFFLVSGFCIHFPYRKGRAIEAGSFYIRRTFRILGPAIVYILILRYVFGSHDSVNNTVLWSVVCECIYYLLYPLILTLRRRSSWTLLVTLSFVAAAVLIIWQRQRLPFGDNSYIALGGWTWMVGLPCWLMGCWLAETYTSFPVLTPLKMWSFRILLWAMTVIENLYHFHATGMTASGCVLLDLFTLPACFWLGCEILYVSRHGSSRVLEWCGAWSYSLYLIHTTILLTLALVGLQGLNERWSTHFLVLALAFAFSYLYYLAVERPSHRLAIAVSRHYSVWLRGKVA